jgi:outer membrane protein OmpA-like peptidoglycan-associated protein
MKTRYVSRYVGLVIFLLLSFACSSMPARTELGEPKSAIFYSTKNIMDRAVTERADEFAPQTYKTAVKYYFTAEDKFEKGENKDEVQKQLQKAQEWAEKSIEYSKSLKSNFPELVIARDKALGVNANKKDLDSYNKANKTFLKVASDVADGKIDKAREKAQEARKNFSMAELQVIQDNMVGELSRKLDEIEEEGAKKWAPETFQQALNYRDAALQSLADNRYNEQRAQAKVNQGDYYARKALFLTDKIKEAKGDKANWEKLFLQREQDLNQIASSLGVSPEFDKGFQEPVSDIDGAINELKRREQAFSKSLSYKEEALTQAEQQIKQAELARAEAERQIKEAEEAKKRITSELATNVKTQKVTTGKVRDLQKLFPLQEGEVKVDPSQNITIVLRSLNFDVNKAVLKPEHYRLVAQVKQALDMFPNQKVVISGHTDFTGSSEFNKKLSLERAEAVRKYLESLGVEDTRLRAVGAGESNPIAPNNTPEGRKLNRRIEVTILSK